MKTELVPFYGDQITLIEQDGEPYVAVKPICERLELNWKSQFAKLRGHPERYSVVLIATESGQGEREMTCLPLRKLPAWLYSIHPNKVRPDLREVVERYQAECDDVLWVHWSGEHGREQRLLQRRLTRAQEYLLAHHPIWGRIKHLQAAGVTAEQMAAHLRREDAETEMHILEMQDLGLIDAADWGKNASAARDRQGRLALEHAEAADG